MGKKGTKLTPAQLLNHRTKWYATMRLKLGVATDEEVNAIQRERGLRAKRTGNGGFKSLQNSDPNRLKEISSKGGKARWQKKSQ